MVSEILLLLLLFFLFFLFFLVFVFSDLVSVLFFLTDGSMRSNPKFLFLASEFQGHLIARS